MASNPPPMKEDPRERLRKTRQLDRFWRFVDRHFREGMLDPGRGRGTSVRPGYQIRLDAASLVAMVATARHPGSIFQMTCNGLWHD